MLDYKSLLNNVKLVKIALQPSLVVRRGDGCFVAPSLEDRRSFISVEESHARSPVAARVFLAVAHLTWSCRANLLIVVQSSTINVISVSKKYPSKVPVVFTIEINFVEVAQFFRNYGAGFVILSFISFFNRSTAKAFQ